MSKQPVYGLAGFALAALVVTGCQTERGSRPFAQAPAPQGTVVQGTKGWGNPPLGSTTGPTVTPSGGMTATAPPAGSRQGTPTQGSFTTTSQTPAPTFSSAVQTGQKPVAGTSQGVSSPTPTPSGSSFTVGSPLPPAAVPAATTRVPTFDPSSPAPLPDPVPASRSVPQAPGW